MKKKEPMLIITIDPSKRCSEIEFEDCTATLIDETGEIELVITEFPFGHQVGSEMCCSAITLLDKVRASEEDPDLLKRKVDLINHFFF